MSDDIRLRVSSWGVWSFILGILALALFATTGSYAILPLLAVIFGHLARREIKAGQRWGRNYAIVGLGFGYIVLAVAFITAITS